MSKAASRLQVTKMNRTSVAVVLLMTVLAIVQTSFAAVQIDCRNIRIKCQSFEASECVANGGKFVHRGGLCGYCDACVTYVGEGSNCTSQVPPLPTPTCHRPLVCSEGVCKHPKEVLPPGCPGFCTMQYNPVCGTDGHLKLVFGNSCLYEFFLKCKARENSHRWKIVSDSHCPELTSTPSPSTEASEKDCPGVCIATYNPVCGSDGKTTKEFDNTCLYESYVRCQVNNSKEWDIVPKSTCQKARPAEGPNKDSEIEREGLSCPGVCSLEFDPICGSDGITTKAFANKCQYDFHLRCQVNNSKEWNLISNKNCPDLNKNYQGEDRLGEPCPGFCTLEYNPVCGFDGNVSIAFANECQYSYYQRCQVNNSRDWKLVSMSVCHGPATTNVSGNDSAKSCPGICTFDYNTVCGSDGNTTMTFPNRCRYDDYLRCDAQNPKEWKLLPDSACLNPVTVNDTKKNSSVESSTSESCPGICSLGYIPVCGSDGKTTMTFNNKCHYDHHVRCVVDNKNEWKLLSNYACQKPDSEGDRIKDTNVEQPTKESCPGTCSLDYNPICGSDGNVNVGFANKCQYDFHLLCKVKNSKDWNIVPNIDCLKPETSKRNSSVETCPGLCTSEIAPVCGSVDGITLLFGNRCQYEDHLRCQAKNPQNWKILPKSACIRVTSNESQKVNSSNVSSPPNKIQRHRSNNRVR